MILRGVDQGDSTRIEVLDSGPGIPDAERKAVFRRFYRAEGSSQHGGFGLGLSIVAAIVNLHGFTLEVGSSEYGGARLVLDCRGRCCSHGTGTAPVARVLAPARNCAKAAQKLCRNCAEAV